MDICIYTYMQVNTHMCIYMYMYLRFYNLPSSFTSLTKVSFIVAPWGRGDRALVGGCREGSLLSSSSFPLYTLLMPKDENTKLALSLGIYEQKARMKHKTI